MSQRVDSALDAMVAIAGKLLGFLGNAIIRHRAEQVLAQLWQEGYVPIKRSELESWRIHAMTLAQDAKTTADAYPDRPKWADLATQAKLLAGSLQHLLTEWRVYHERQPQQTETRFRKGTNRRDQR